MDRQDRTRWATAAGLGTGVAVFARRRDSLSPLGAVAAAIVGTTVYGAAGARGSALLLTFFGSSTALSRLPRTRRPASQADHAGTATTGPRRTLVQVMANGGVPAALAAARLTRPGDTSDPAGPVVHAARERVLAAAYAGALAAANADTWATEIGRGSRSPPRIVTTGRIAEPGVSGAVSPRGTAASLAGALLIGLAHAALAVEPGTALPARSTAALRVAAAGFVGALMDSVLGATVQTVYLCRVCALRTEDRTHAHAPRQPQLRRVRGLPGLTNDTVNLCASLTGAGVAALFARPHVPTAPRDARGASGLNGPS